ncbi:MAG: hypothetical protein RMI94_04895 [Bryobacterales bacterium]|nr:hypothetical protein [Bryobacteraceae bacterium]MDW8129864.1 hypothetical protein [Bryobacterales bacterium]
MKERDHFDELLSVSLRRIAPPPSLRTRILASLHRRRCKLRSLWLRVAVVIVLVLTVRFAFHWQERRRGQEQALEGRRQLEFALRMTRERLLEIERELNRIGVREIRFEEAGP